MTEETGVVGGSDWFSEEQATFGDRLAGAREAAGLTQKEMARRLGIKLGTLRNWEEDLNEPRANKLQMVSGLLGVSLSWLLTGRGDGPEVPESAGALDDDAKAILAEMRGIRARMQEDGERLARLEKRLRAALREPA